MLGSSLSSRPSKIQSSLGRKQKTQIRTSHIIVGVLGVLFVVTVIAFGSSIHWIMKNHDSDSLGTTTTTREGTNRQPSHKNSDSSSNSNNLRQQQQPAKTASSAISDENAIEQVKEEFYNRYGGKTIAEEYFDKTITSFGSIDDTAAKILRSIALQQPFVMGFAGYSVTVGRGNFFNQSFPFVVERVLQKPMKAVGVPSFIVRNSAIGGIPSFPFMFCAQHHVGADLDLISWDFSMNEKAKDPAVFEAYIRQALKQLPKQPFFIMVDNNAARTKLLEEYVRQSILPGALTVSKVDSVVDKSLLEKPDSEKPPGLQQWEEFGAPGRCPGRGSWHPKMREHEFMGWMMAMYFVKALDRVKEIQQSEKPWRDKYGRIETRGMSVFPAPISELPPDNDRSANEILFGHKIADNQYQMKDLSCRTNFLPATDFDKVLPSLVVSGLSTRATAENIMDQRSDDFYKQGWVLDVSDVERGTKRKVEKCGGLGYIDMKIALYGIPESGPLELFLPYEGRPHDHSHDADTDTDAQHWFDGLIICEANDKREDAACKLDQDIEYVVGGVPVTHVSMVSGAGEYLKRKTCVNIGLPPGAKVTRRKVSGMDASTDESRGLPLILKAKPKVTREGGACCISHVVWEQH